MDNDQLDLESASRALNIEKWRLKGALGRGSIYFVGNFSPAYFLFRKDVGKIESGTSVFLHESPVVVRGFPKIKRAFVLEPLISMHFKSEIALEEKMNGYNVRVAMAGGLVVALTRGGFVCPYTTSRIRSVPGIREFLDENEDLMLCGEVVGMENPYVVHSYPEAPDFGFFVFDIRGRSDNVPLPIGKRNSILAQFRLNPVRLIDQVEVTGAADKIISVTKKLGEENREGLILKDPEMVLDPIKYTPSSTNSNDLTYAFGFPYEYGKDFFFSRIIREGYQAFEWHEDEKELEERALRLGKSILYPMVENIRKVQNGELLSEKFSLLVENEDQLDLLIAYLRSQRVTVIVEDKQIENGRLRARIIRPRTSSTDRIRAVLSGKGG